MGIFAMSAVLGFCGSVFAKWLADTYLTEHVSIMGQFVGLDPSFNAGIAFGVNLPYQDLIIFLALVLVCVIAWKTAKTKLSQVGYGFIVGGALANIADRFSDKLVTDFFQVGTFPVFNVADSCITIGVVLLLLEMILERRNGSRGA